MLSKQWKVEGGKDKNNVEKEEIIPESIVHIIKLDNMIVYDVKMPLI